jgi:predicted DsbA family dithiol-disulfide isomerase
MPNPLPITVYSDVICPWCCRQAPAGGCACGPHADRVDSHGAPSAQSGHAAGRGAGLPGAQAASSAVGWQAPAASWGSSSPSIACAAPNTRLAHHLIWKPTGKTVKTPSWAAVGYFEEGLDIGRRDVLESSAAEAGLESDGVERALTSSDSLEAVTKLEQQGYAMGIQGVPFFILLAKYGISGAQHPEFWREALPKIAAAASSAG